jgi:hypothetical protein
VRLPPAAGAAAAAAAAPPPPRGCCCHCRGAASEIASSPKTTACLPRHVNATHPPSNATPAHKCNNAAPPCSSHSILVFALRQTAEPHKQVGKLSFIDLAGSERGAGAAAACCCWWAVVDSQAGLPIAMLVLAKGMRISSTRCVNGCPLLAALQSGCCAAVPAVPSTLRVLCLLCPQTRTTTTSRRGWRARRSTRACLH